MREVDVSDLLGRDPVPPNEQLLDACIRGKVVMVTGAGGSIGSELCRQIAAPRPAPRWCCSRCPSSRSTRSTASCARSCERERLSIELAALLGNAHHKYRVREIMQAYGVQTVYHAAAYKHVPIVEQNVIEGIHNNVIGTWYTAEAALECGVETFVLISTDKAVNPTNVMGATKRLAEMVLQGLQQRGARTRFCMVRFGNVLESSGSVVPLFREQIRRGGPVTVTHPDVIRYFMTIPEAAQLVLQAGAMAQGGDVFVLDMGKPVRIVDLARRMIQPVRAHGARRREPGRRHRDPLHRPAAGREAVRGAADRQQRHRHRPPDDHAGHGAFAALGRRCRSCCTICWSRWGSSTCAAPGELLLRGRAGVPARAAKWSTTCGAGAGWMPGAPRRDADQLNAIESVPQQGCRRVLVGQLWHGAQVGPANPPRPDRPSGRRTRRPARSTRSSCRESPRSR